MKLALIVCLALLAVGCDRVDEDLRRERFDACMAAVSPERRDASAVENCSIAAFHQARR